MDQPTKQPTNFTVKQQWERFLERSGFKPGELPAVQEIEMSKAFYGSAGQMLLMLRDELSELPEMEAMQKLEGMLSEIGVFWQDKAKEYDEMNKGEATSEKSE